MTSSSAQILFNYHAERDINSCMVWELSSRAIYVFHEHINKNKLGCRVTFYHIKLALEWVLDQASIPRHLISTGTRFAVPVGQVPYLDKLGMNQVIF